MSKNRNITPVKVGLDANVVIYLARLDRSVNELDQKVIEELEKGTLNADDYKTTNFRDFWI